MEIKNDDNFCTSNQIHLSVKNNKLILSTCCGTFFLDEINIKDFLNCDDVIKFLKSKIENLYIINKKTNEFGYCELKKEYCCFVGKKTKIKNLYISISQSCNLNCSFCFMDKQHTNEYDDLYFKVLNKLIEKEYNFNFILLTNYGEPFFNYNKTIDFLKKIKKENFKGVYFITNGTLLNKERIDELYNISKEKNIKIEIQVSLNAFNKDTYKNLMGKDYFDKVLENILYLKEKNLLMLVSYVIVKENEKEVEEFKNFFKERNIITTTNIASLPENYYT